jgi:hypothetical protein
MKKTSKTITRIIALAMFLFCLALNAMAANTTTEVAKVTTAVTLTQDVDYVITDATPFEGDGVVNIQNTEHAVLILLAVKPSKALNLLSSRVKINGAAAVNGQNCQVKLYNRGTIILPYEKNFKPLTVYSERNYGGESYNNFGLENSGGYMNTLPTAWNNRIRSFKLKRGYMVTFSTRANGRGYSRCFVAAYADRTFTELPNVLDGTISSYRVFKWYDASKAGLANDTRKEACDALNVQSCYSFSLGEDRGVDCECVPHHIYEDWPSSSECGSVTYSPHLKTNNEPGNSADDRPQSVEMVLANWENLMATGMRLCSPSSHDGSLNHLRAVMDSIDARGWRCDIIDIHSYWDKGKFGDLWGWYNSYKRPIWVSEWVWGASWNNNGIFNTSVYNRDNPGDKEYNDNKNAIAEICGKMNGWDYVERYFYWNSEAPCSRVYDGGRLTPAGEWYAAQQPGLAFKANYEHVPNNPRQYDISDFEVSYDKKERKATISWYDKNGEYNRSHVLQRSTDGGKNWVDFYTPKQLETASDYKFEDETARDGYRYRVRIVDLENKERLTNVKVAALVDVVPGDAVTVDGNTMYVGGNMMVNGDFDLGFTGWTNSKGEVLSHPHFYIANVGDEHGNHLLCWVNQSHLQVGSVRTAFDVVPNGQYYFSAKFCNTGGMYQTIDVEDVNGGTTVETPVFRTIACSDWTLQDGNFNVGNHDKMYLKFRWLPMARIDECFLARLFPTVEEAMADAAEQARSRARAYINYNNIEAFNTELQGIIDATYATNEEAVTTIEVALKAATKAVAQMSQLDALAKRAAVYAELGMPGSDVLVPLVAAANQLTSAAQVPELVASLSRELAAISAWQTTNLIPNANFTSNYGWVNTSTYGGDQRRHTVLGRSCWNSWWSGTKDAVKNGTMGIEQELSGLSEGLYYLSCAATTEHYCLSDQHAFMKSDDQKAVSPVLTCDRFDYPGLDNAERWETLSTTPLYLPEGGSVTVGFESSKQGALDGAWIAGPDKTAADNREGWWCATDFVLYRFPLHQRSFGGAHWGTVCLPYAVTPGPGVQFYEVAGVLTEGEQQYICLQPIAEQQAGVPFVYYSDRGIANFFESGDALTSPIDGSNGLRGIFNDYTISRRLVGAIVLVNGTFYQLGSEEVPYELSKYYAYINKLANVGTLESWSGMKLPLAPEGSLNTGVAQPKATPAAQPLSVYKLDGQRVKQPTSGVNILQKGADVKKVLVK